MRSSCNTCHSKHIDRTCICFVFVEDAHWQVQAVHFSQHIVGFHRRSFHPGALPSCRHKHNLAELRFLCASQLSQMRVKRRGSLLSLVCLGFGCTFCSYGSGVFPRRTPHSFAPESSLRGSRVSRAAVFSVLAEEVNHRPAFFFGEVFIIVVLSAGFEKAEKWLRERLKTSGDYTGRKILDALFREITILGFIGLLLFVLTHLLPEDSPLISFGQAEYNILPETFEYVHMATFLLLVVLLFQGFAVLRISRETANTWADYERVRAFGMSETSIESMLVEEGYLERQPAANGNGFELQTLKPFTYGEGVIERALLRRKYVHKLVMWRAVRHGFLFDGPQSKLLVSEGAVIPGLFSFETFLEQQLGQIAAPLKKAV